MFKNDVGEFVGDVTRLPARLAKRVGDDDPAIVDTKRARGEGERLESLEFLKAFEADQLSGWDDGDAKVFCQALDIEWVSGA
jgi:hypothetical protein